MPLYEYVCEECGLIGEAFVSVEDRDSEFIRCGRCYDANHPSVMKRVIAKPAIRGETVAWRNQK